MGKSSKIIRVVHIGLRKQEDEIVKKIDQDGDSVSEIVRTLLKNYSWEKWGTHSPMTEGTQKGGENES